MDKTIQIPENLSIGDMLIFFGNFMKKYELLYKQNELNNDKNIEIISTKEVLRRYPCFKQHSLIEATRKKDIPIIKVGKLNFYDINDINNYLERNKAFIKSPVSKDKVKEYV